MDTTRKIGTSYCHVPCLYFYVAFLRICYYKDATTPSIILSILLLILLLAYIIHYYQIENGVQKWCLISNQIKQRYNYYMPHNKFNRWGKSNDSG